jgi:hypothetical protein
VSALGAAGSTRLLSRARSEAIDQVGLELHLPSDALANPAERGPLDVCSEGPHDERGMPHQPEGTS